MRARSRNSPSQKRRLRTTALPHWSIPIWPRTTSVRRLQHRSRPRPPRPVTSGPRRTAVHRPIKPAEIRPPRPPRPIAPAPVPRPRGPTPIPPMGPAPAKQALAEVHNRGIPKPASPTGTASRAPNRATGRAISRATSRPRPRAVIPHRRPVPTEQLCLWQFQPRPSSARRPLTVLPRPRRQPIPASRSRSPQRPLPPAPLPSVYQTRRPDKPKPIPPLRPARPRRPAQRLGPKGRLRVERRP
jgi:hypothetical protein